MPEESDVGVDDVIALLQRDHEDPIATALKAARKMLRDEQASETRLDTRDTDLTADTVEIAIRLRYREGR